MSNDPHDNELTDREMLTRFARRSGPEDRTPAELLAEAGGAFDRTKIELSSNPERPYHIEVHRPAQPATVQPMRPGRVATMEHMDLTRDELVALGDRIWEVLSS